MAIATNLARQRYTGDGGTTVFWFSFPVWSISQIKVYTGNNRSETQVTSGFVVNLNAVPAGAKYHAGGNVTFGTAPASGTSISIVRAMPFIQEDVYASGARFDAKEIEDRYDMDCAERQELWDGVLRAVKMPGTSTQTPQQFSDSLFGAADTATQKAGEAAASATAAANSATAAGNSATSAANSATAAGLSASQAAVSAVQAGNYASDANGYATNAYNSSIAAANSATAANNSATAAAGSETNSYNHSETSRKWAVGTIAEQPAGSSKYWANKAESIMSTHPSITRWIIPTVIGQTVYNFPLPNPTNSDVEKYLVFYGTDLLNTNDYVINITPTQKTITLTEAPEEVLNLTIAYVAEGLIESDIIPIGAVFSVIGCEDTYVPNGALPCDGAEKSKTQFPDFYIDYLCEKTYPWVQPALSANGTLGSSDVAVYANSELDSSSLAYKAMDNDNTTDWMIETTPPASIDYVLYSKTALNVTNIEITNKSGADNNAFTAGTVFGSNDNVTYAPITTFTNTEQARLGVWNIDLSSNTNKYKYYKITFTNHSGVNAGCNNIKFTATISYSLLKTCSYYDYQTDIATYGSCAKWGLDATNEKFKVPTIPDGTFLQQASTAGEMGKSYKHDLATGTDYSHKSVTVRYFVQVANAQVNQSTMDWSAWASGLAGKANQSDLVAGLAGKVSKSGDTMTGDLAIGNSGTNTSVDIKAAIPKINIKNTDAIYSMALNNTSGFNPLILNSNNNNSCLSLSSGVYGHCAELALHGNDDISSGYAGQFTINLWDSSGNLVELRGKPNKDLTWHGIDIGIDSIGSTWIRYGNGIQICWFYTPMILSSGTTVTLPKNFIDTSYRSSIVCSTNDTGCIITIDTITTSTINFKSNRSGGVSAECICIGYWK